MSKYVVFDLVKITPGIAVVVEGGTLFDYVEYYGEPISQHETLEEARAVAEAIAAFKNLTIRSWSL